MLRSYEAFIRGDDDLIDIDAVKAYMKLRGLNFLQLADMLQLSNEDSVALQLEMKMVN